MELRDIEILLTLAQELHFGRTAQRLQLSQARISQSIKGQERRLGALLVDRTNPRNIRLTPLGTQLCADLLPAYRDVRQALDRARSAAGSASTMLRIGIIGGNAHDYRSIWQTFRTRHPEFVLQIRSISFTDPFGPLRRGETDVVIAWLPVEEPDLTVGPTLFIEPMGAAVSDNRELAGVKGRSIQRISTVSNGDNVSTSVLGSDGAIHNVSDHLPRYYNRPGVSYLPITDAHLLRWALVWHSESETDQIRALARIVGEFGRPDHR
ncbi:LysR family transcriptional regulator [Nocardia sp. NBC_00403]|uniref:LysR family transcriptional regulator n=1 Tax=Nocardia sp. NBC_00403 TaxID=2975990 RepID=UPI002E20664B